MSWPCSASSSTRVSAPAVSRSIDRVAETEERSSSTTVPTSCSTSCTETSLPGRRRELIEVEIASRNEPPAPRAISASAASGASIDSPSQTRRSDGDELLQPRAAGTTNVWQRERTVGSTLERSVVQKTKTRWGGGSSISFSSAFQACRGELVGLVDDVDLVARPPPAGAPPARGSRGRRRCRAARRRPSRSRRARVPSAIARAIAGCRVEVRVRAALGVQRLREDPRHRRLARCRAGPAKRYAWRTCPCSIAFRSVRTTASCPITSAEVERAVGAIQGGYGTSLLRERKCQGSWGVWG